MDLSTMDRLFDAEEMPDTHTLHSDIAIIGLSVRVGEMESPEQLWQALCNGENLIREIPAHRAADADAFARALDKTPGKYRKSSYLEHIDLFDPAFFHILPKDAAYLDPAQRLMLEEAWKAIDNAGLTREQLDATRTGVYIGYSAEPVHYNELVTKEDPVMANRSVSGKVPSVIASRLSYYLNLHGPAMLIDTACSSSLTAVHIAAQAIQQGDCDQAVVGGVHFSLLPPSATIEEEVSVESEDATTRTFDRDASGTCPGEGVVAVVLKSLEHAERDNNPILAVLKGSAVNQDGRSVGITAPNAEAQKELLIEAWERAGIDPSSLSYIEAHGTATNIGDPVEFLALQEAMSSFTEKKQFCALGAIKTNAGHLDSAAGLLGLVKCVLALEYEQLPPTLHFCSPNPALAIIDSAFYIQDSLSSWQSAEPLRCGVSSFGMSGTNCHCVLEQYPHRTAAQKTGNKEKYHRERCWVNPVPLQSQSISDALAAENPTPLGNLLVSTAQLHVFQSFMSEDTHSEVREHIIGERHVLAGTVYIDMLMRAAESLFSLPLHLQQIVFLSFSLYFCRQTNT